MHVQLSPTKRARVISLRKRGEKFQDIADELHCHKSSAIRAWQRYHEKENFYAVTPGRGRPRCLEPYERRKACQMIRSGQSATAADVQRDRFPEVSARTMRRTLEQEGLHGRRKRKVPLMTKVHKIKRQKWAADHAEWEVQDWQAVIFSDESKFNLYGSDGIQYCRRGPNEEFEARNVQQRLKHGGGRIMVWGCITSKGFGRLVRVEGNMNAIQYCQILEEGLLGTLDDHDIDRRSIYFQQDNDPKHTSRCATTWFAKNRFDLLAWPPNSPDMNIIENVWNQLEVNYNRRPYHARNEDELFEMLREEWENLSQAFCSRLYESMPARIKELQHAKGSWTRH